MGRRQNQVGDSDSDDAAIGLSASDKSLLGTILGTDRTRRIAVDDDGNVQVDVVGGSISVGEVEIKNDSGNPVPVSGPLTDTELRASAVPISVASLPLPSGASTEVTLDTLSDNVAKTFGTWAYYAGVSGSVSVTAGQRVLGIAAHSTLGGSFTINGGAAITIPANSGISINPVGNLTAPTIVFTTTDSYFIEVVS